MSVDWCWPRLKYFCAMLLVCTVGIEHRPGEACFVAFDAEDCVYSLVVKHLIG